MRVTTNSFNNDLRHNITRLAERQLRLQQQVSTGQRITTASDDPKAMRRVLDARQHGTAGSRRARTPRRGKPCTPRYLTL